MQVQRLTAQVERFDEGCKPCSVCSTWYWTVWTPDRCDPKTPSIQSFKAVTVGSCPCAPEGRVAEGTIWRRPSAPQLENTICPSAGCTPSRSVHRRLLELTSVTLALMAPPVTLVFIRWISMLGRPSMARASSISWLELCACRAWFQSRWCSLTRPPWAGGPGTHAGASAVGEPPEPALPGASLCFVLGRLHAANTLT